MHNNNQRYRGRLSLTWKVAIFVLGAAAVAALTLVWPTGAVALSATVPTVDFLHRILSKPQDPNGHSANTEKPS